MADLAAWIARLESEEPQPCYLLHGDRVVAEPAALRLGEAIGQRAGCRPQVHHRPPRLGDLLADLRTFSLFDPAKVLVAVDSAALAETAAAAELIDEAAAVLPVEAGAEPTGRERQAALRLMRALRLFDLDPYAGEPAALLEQLPAWAYRGRSKRRPAASAKKVRSGLEALLEMARAAELAGYGESDGEELAAVLRDGLPRGHSLILAESSVAAEHPVVRALAERGALAELGRVESSRGGWKGLEPLQRELETETGAALSSSAARELARRTLRTAPRAGRDAAAVADSTSRFAAEYRKLAALSGGGTIERELVESAVEDRGQEEAWGVLDAIGEGRPGEALEKLSRMLAGADDPVAARLAFFALLAGFCRQLAAVGGMLAAGEAQPGVTSYPRFKNGVAPKLQGERGGAKSPLAGLHPFRLHRVYLAACRIPRRRLAGLADRVLATELALKGESGAPDTALTALVTELAR